MAGTQFELDISGLDPEQASEWLRSVASLLRSIGLSMGVERDPELGPNMRLVFVDGPMDVFALEVKELSEWINRKMAEGDPKARAYVEKIVLPVLKECRDLVGQLDSVIRELEDRGYEVD